MESPRGDSANPTPDADDQAAAIAARYFEPSAGHALGVPAAGGQGTAARGPAAVIPPPSDLVRAPKPAGLWEVMQRQIDDALADFLGGDYPRGDG